ncbi:MAG: nuclear transport factor 2 family protein [Pseudomonadota bacterium]
MHIKKAVAAAFLAATGIAAAQETCTDEQIEANKEIARGFYQDLWFTDNTDRYTEYVADTYQVWDIGDRKGVTEKAIEQKVIADRFHGGATMTGEIQFMVADCERVATRWTATSKPTSLVGHIMIGDTTLPIINVVKIEDGKIVEFWNHRHDIDASLVIFKTAPAFIKGVLVGAIPFGFLYWRARRKS